MENDVEQLENIEDMLVSLPDSELSELRLALDTVGETNPDGDLSIEYSDDISYDNIIKAMPVCFRKSVEKLLNQEVNRRKDAP